MSEEYEKSEENKFFLKGLFPKMKTWYISDNVSENFREKYGPYPLFWQDLDTWVHTKILKKIYLCYTEKKEAGLEVEDISIIENKILDAEISSSNVDENENENIDIKFKVDPVLNTEVSSSNLINIPTASTYGISSEHVESNTTSDTSKKRKKNRWGMAPSTPTDSLDATLTSVVESKVEENINDNSNTNQIDSTTDCKKPRKSRFSAATTATAGITDMTSFSLGGLPVTLPSSLVMPTIPPPVVQTPEQIQQTIVLKMQLQQINTRMLTVAQDAAAIEADPNRSPSPPPKYDKEGKRTNTRVLRMRDSLMQDRSKIAEQLMKLNPAFSAPLELLRTKPVRKIPIPVNQMPNQSFIGLIIGPRGNTQKRMEQETNTKISIKGKGMRGSANLSGESDEELHVHITGEDDKSVDAAAKLVLELLQPKNEEAITKHKEGQLRELALINGTLREDEYCPVCGEKGHKQYECPARIKSFKAAGVKCSICGDGSHPTRDCPLKQNTQVGEAVLDSEYDSLMAELNGGVPSSSTKAPAPTSNTSDEKLFPANPTAAASTSDNSTEWCMPVKKQQTIIHVTSVLTGTGPPPVAYSTPSTSTPAVIPVGIPSVSTAPVAAGLSYSYPNPSSSVISPTTTGYPQQQPAVGNPTLSGYGGYYATPAMSNIPAAVPVYNPMTGTYYYAPAQQSQSYGQMSQQPLYQPQATVNSAWGYPQQSVPIPLQSQQPSVIGVNPISIPAPVQPPPPGA